jgi:hypothetical protein
LTSQIPRSTIRFADGAHFWENKGNSADFPETDLLVGVMGTRGIVPGKRKVVWPQEAQKTQKRGRELMNRFATFL